MAERTYNGQSRADLEKELFSDPAPTAAPAAPAKSPEHQALEQELFGGAAGDGGLSDAQVAAGKDAYGRPFQSLRAVPANDPVGQATGLPIASGQLPGPVTQAIGSLPTDPEQRRRVIAAQLFPGMAPNEATSRVFYGDGGRLAAVGMDGKPFYVDPAPLNVSIPSSFMPSNLLATGAGMAGPALPTMGGLAGGALSAPTSLVAGPVMAAGGAAIGDVGRQYLARSFDPQPDMARYNPTQTMLEAGGAGVGQLGGSLVVRGLSPNRLAASPLDINRLRAGVLPEAERVNSVAAGQGVQLTPGQASGLPSLLGHEDAIASGSAGPNLTDTSSAFYRRQGQQISDAGQNMLDRVSPVTDKTDAAMQFSQGAEDATRITRQDANAAARPSYEAAQKGGTVMSPDLAQLVDSTPALQSAIARARVEYQNLYRKPAPDSPDFALWDLAKRQLDDAHGIAKRAGENTTAMSVDSVRSDLLTHLDAAYPDYATARATAAPGQRLAARLESSVGGAAGDGTEKARAIVAPVFEGNNPRAISEARDAFTAAGRGDEWNAGVRAYIQDAFDKASQSQAGLNPKMLRTQIWGKVDNREAIKAAMDPAAYAGFDNFMQTVEAAAKTYPMNSLTTPRGEARNALLNAAGDTVGVHTAEMAGAALNPFKLAQVGNVIPEKIAGYLRGRNLQSISEKLFSPEGMDYLRAMGNLSPGSQKAITATSEFLIQTATRAGAANANASPNRLLAAPAR